MKNAFRKDIYREIKNTFSRFAAIFAIVALGVAFYSGIGATGMDMKLTGEAYFDAQNLMDIRVISTYGLNNDDIAAISAADGVASVSPAYSMDAQVNDNGVTLIIKLHSIETG
ncbi:MAG: ABC transporter permease, partial [Clostridiales bacterium]|nr:ABC transporter permease [Clostridiales bacterium]